MTIRGQSYIHVDICMDTFMNRRIDITYRLFGHRHMSRHIHTDMYSSMTKDIHCTETVTRKKLHVDAGTINGDFTLTVTHIYGHILCQWHSRTYIVI